MNPRSGLNARWLVSGVMAAGVVVVTLVLFRPPWGGPPPRSLLRRQRPPITLSPGRPDELAMRDLAPLFLPTRYNAAPSELHQLEPGGSFFERDAERWRFSESATSLHVPLPVTSPPSTLEALADTPGPLALGMGRSDRTVPPAGQSGGHVDVYAPEARESLFSVTLEPAARPAASARDVMGWRPLEFTAAVDETGLVGPLLLTKSSGVEDVDNHFRNYLARTFRLGDRLPPGFYRVVVGP